MDLSLTCATDDLTLHGGIQLQQVRQAVLTVDMHWTRADLLPKGLIGLFNRSDFGDTAGWREAGPQPWWWQWTEGPGIVDLETGAAVGSWGSTSPSVGLLPHDVAGTNTIVIEPAAIQAGDTIRATRTLYTETDATWPRIEVFYAHLDRFLLKGTVGCGETVVAGEIRVPTSAEPYEPPLGHRPCSALFAGGPPAYGREQVWVLANPEG